MKILLLVLLVGLPNFSSPWDLVFSDEFNDSKLDESKWEYQLGCSEEFGAWNLQCYIEGNNNIELTEGHLRIIPRIQNAQDKNFTSGRIRMRGPGFKGGLFLARARLPQGHLLWPALWLLARDQDCYHEIDIMEAVGDSPWKVLFTAHYGHDFRNLTRRGSRLNSTTIDFSKDFHEFGLIWEEETLTWFIDDWIGLVIPTNKDSWTSSGKVPCEESPFSRPMNYIINLAVGGTMFGSNVTMSPEEAHEDWKGKNSVFEVDWIRIYQKLDKSGDGILKNWLES